MQTSYCIQWSRGSNRPIKMSTEDQARLAHERHELYTALIGDPQRPSCFLEFTPTRSVAVEFLDGALRTFFDYSFQQRRPGEVFVSMSRRLHFPNEVEATDRGYVFYFNPAGKVIIVRYEAHATGVGSKVVDRHEQEIDVSRNWEPFPEFGHYQGLMTLDRGSDFLRPPQDDEFNW